MNTSQIQSALGGAAGSHAALLHELGVVLYTGAALIFIVVITLALLGAFSKPKPVRWQRWIIGGGLAFPIATLSALLGYSLSIGNSLEVHPPGDALRIEIIGRQWWWEVRYIHPDGDGEVVLANEVHLPTGRPAHLTLKTGDVIHSFWVPPLAGKVDMIPGRTTRLVVRSDEAAMFRGQCAEYCGGQHAWMALFVVVEPKERFDAWLTQQARGVTVPSDPFLKLGHDAFFKGGCDECHAVRGTRATSTAGPDLTHVGGRESLAAGMLKNHIGTMAGWIAGPQDIKPGSLMPPVDVYTGQELRAVSAWLESLE
jgi:cytochrome c oxidase subunit II